MTKAEALADHVAKATQITHFILAISPKYGHQTTTPVYMGEDIKDAISTFYKNNSRASDLALLVYDVNVAPITEPRIVLDVVKRVEFKMKDGNNNG